MHAEAKTEADDRADTVNDKISREDIPAHASAQYRSNKGAAGVEGQNVADVQAYGVQRWQGELALALGNEGDRADPIEPAATYPLDKPARHM